MIPRWHKSKHLSSVGVHAVFRVRDTWVCLKWNTQPVWNTMKVLCNFTMIPSRDMCSQNCYSRTTRFPLRQDCRRVPSCVLRSIKIISLVMQMITGWQWQRSFSHFKTARAWNAIDGFPCPTICVMVLHNNNLQSNKLLIIIMVKNLNILYSWRVVWLKRQLFSENLMTIFRDNFFPMFY